MYIHVPNAMLSEVVYGPDVSGRARYAGLAAPRSPMLTQKAAAPLGGRPSRALALYSGSLWGRPNLGHVSGNGTGG